MTTLDYGCVGNGLALFTKQDRQDLTDAALRAAAEGSRKLELTAGLRRRMYEAALLYGVGMPVESWP